MAKSENNDSFPDKQTWGTWEELLLACAVHRHGTESWNSVFAEIQKRSPKLRSLTASACRHKYFDLKRRFTRKLALQRSSDLESVAEISTVPWLEELRKLRVDELRREVEQYDLSISSLQSKVKKLEEEREMKLNEPDTEIENSDLKITAKKLRRESDSDSGEPVSKPLIQSENESYSSDLKDNSPKTSSETLERNEDMSGAVECKENRNIDGGEAKLAREVSFKGSSESVENKSAANLDRVQPGRGTEPIESMSESEGGAKAREEDCKETSDVQSSASLSRNGTSGQEDQSTSTKDFPDESQPSINFVEILLSEPCGSHFSHRLESQLQKTPKYGKIIKQHVDFEIIQKRIEEGSYKSSRSNFFRDLLLLINNAKVFYHKESSEFKSAEKLNQLVKKQMTTFKKPGVISSLKEKSLELVVTVSSKPRLSVPIVACRESEKKSKKTDHGVEDEKLVSDKDDDESLILKKITRGRTYSVKKVVNRNVKNCDSSLNVEEKKRNINGSSKKKSVESFLKRIKVGSLSETIGETLNPSSVIDSSRKVGAEEMKNNNNKVDVKKQAKTGKKNNSRCLKRETASSSSPAKRSREAGEKETVSCSTRLKKRVRR